MVYEIGLGSTGFRLGLSLVLSGLIGIEREVHGKSAGLRTHMLVGLGSALFTVLSFVLPGILGSTTSDPTRIAAQVLTGVGFLGAGTILQARGSVHGLTTAASIWLVAAIGMAVGAGFYIGALLATGLGQVVLTAFSRLEQNMIRRKWERHEITARIGVGDAAWFEQLMIELSPGPSRWETEREDCRLLVRVEGRFGKRDLTTLLSSLRERGTMEQFQVRRG
jgi:putative Mg2+ transporter-C (MgtC) family protein